MGQKVNPIGYRLALNREWRSRWYASPKDFPDFLHADIKIRGYVKKKLALAAVSKIVIERAWNSLRVTIYTARPGIVKADTLPGTPAGAPDRQPRPSSSGTSSEFSVNATRWYCPTTIGTSMSCSVL